MMMRLRLPRLLISTLVPRDRLRSSERDSIYASRDAGLLPEEAPAVLVFRTKASACRTDNPFLITASRTRR